MTTTKTRPVTSDAKFAQLFEELKAVSIQALAECPAPTPMIVGSPSTPLGNDVDPNQKTWFEPNGICGFATVVLESGRSGFAQWLVKTGRGAKWWSFGRHKGVGLYSFSRFGFANAGQSYEKNRFIAMAMANHLRNAGFECWVDARVD